MLKSVLVKTVLFILIMLPAAQRAEAVDWSTFQKDWSRNAVIPEDSVTGTLEPQWSKQATWQNYQMPLYQDGIFGSIDRLSCVGSRQFELHFYLSGNKRR